MCSLTHSLVQFWSDPLPCLDKMSDMSFLLPVLNATYCTKDHCAYVRCTCAVVDVPNYSKSFDTLAICTHTYIFFVLQLRPFTLWPKPTHAEIRWFIRIRQTTCCLQVIPSALFLSQIRLDSTILYNLVSWQGRVGESECEREVERERASACPFGHFPSQTSVSGSAKAARALREPSTV